MADYIFAARVADIPEGKCRTVEVAGKSLVICALEGEFFALSAVCPHKAGPLGAIPPAEGSLFCPMHGWEFDVRTGACKNRPDKPVATYPVRVVEGEIQVEIEQDRPHP